MKQRLTLDSIRNLDMGKVSAAFDHEIERIVRDCVDRPYDTSARRVTLQLEEFTIKSKVPDRRSRTYPVDDVAHAVLRLGDQVRAAGARQRRAAGQPGKPGGRAPAHAG